MAKQRTVEDHLPAKAPKKTGKRGVGPVADAMEEANKILEADVVEVVEEDIEGAEEQGVLLEMPDSELPGPVAGEKMLVHFVKPIFKKTKKGERTVALEFSLPLTDEHEDLLHKTIKDGWKFLARKGMKKLDITEVPCHIIKLWLADDQEKEALILPVAGITSVSLATIQEKGSGAAKKVIRLSFRALVKMSAQVGKFSEYHFDENLWFEWHPSQEQLFPDGEEDDE